MIHLDFETRSKVDLTKHGAYLYARDPSTEVLCAAYAVDDGPVRSWTPGEAFPADLRAAIEDGQLLAAHNAGFDRLVWEYVATADHGFPPLALERWYCTATQARARGLPGKLDDLGRCLGLDVQKDKRGRELIKLMSIPPFEHTPELLAEMVAYCVRDVEVERAAASRSAPLTPAELAVYHLSERINDRGLMVDVEFARAAVGYAKDEAAEIGQRLAQLTGGSVRTARQFQKLKAWLEPRLAPKLMSLTQRTLRDRRSGETTTKETLDARTRANLLAALAEDPDLMTDSRVVDVLELASEAGRTSVAKYQAMADRADPEDQRVRGAYICAGAGQTGRWSSTGLQLHNFVRTVSKHPRTRRCQVLRGQPLPSVMDTLASMLRPSVQARPGHVFVCGDWSGIENRVLPWLSQGQPPRNRWEIAAENTCAARLERMATPGNDEYVLTAASFGGTRQEGKVCELSMGFGGGVGAFQAMARNYGVVVPDSRAEAIKTAWRAANPWATRFWSALGSAAVRAMIEPGKWFQAGRLWYGRAPGGPLVCSLPSGRVLTYPEPRLEEGRWGPVISAIKGSWKPKVGEPWPRFDLWSGLQAENVTQAASADVLSGCMLRVDARLPGALVGHTHDELLLEVPTDDADHVAAVLREEMLRGEPWSEGLPLDTAIWIGKRYKK